MVSVKCHPLMLQTWYKICYEYSVEIKNHNLYLTPQIISESLQTTDQQNIQHSCWEQEELTFTKPIHPTTSNPSWKLPLPQHPRKKGGYNAHNLCANITAHHTPALSDRSLGFFSRAVRAHLLTHVFIYRHPGTKKDHLILFVEHHSW